MDYHQSILVYKVAKNVGFQPHVQAHILPTTRASQCQGSVLYGSTTAVATCGQHHTVKEILLFLP